MYDADESDEADSFEPTTHEDNARSQTADDVGSAFGAGSVLGAAVGALGDYERGQSGDSGSRSTWNTVAQIGHAVDQGLSIASGAAHALQALENAVGSPLPRVEYAFRCDSGTSFDVAQVHLREGLSELYECTIVLVGHDEHASAMPSPTESCTLEIRRGSEVRSVRGILRRVERLGAFESRVLCRVHLVPALWALSQRVQSRVFQRRSVRQIVQSVLTDALRPFRRSMRMQIQRELPEREYCVQYQESDLDFVRRLLEDEGIAFWFDHSDETETLVLVDSNEAYQDVPGTESRAIAVHGPEQDHAQYESFRHFVTGHSLEPTSVVVRDYDWTQPELDLTRSNQGASATSTWSREVFEYPGPLTIGAYDEAQLKYTRDDGRARARIDRERFTMEERVATGSGIVTALEAGRTFRVHGSASESADAERFLVTHVEHRGLVPEVTMGAMDRVVGAARTIASVVSPLANAFSEILPGSSSLGLSHLEGFAHGGRHAAPDERYHNTFRAIPSNVAFRPARRTQRPRIVSTQTATVVGPNDERIHTDAHGRIKVQFQWDRAGHRDENSSCWIRVAQTWGGAQWGFQFLPRIGMEVLVAFLDGDPDRPVVVGSLYNGTHPIPFDRAEHQTRSGIRTRTIDPNDENAEGHNELRFDDRAGAEQVYLRAERDLDEHVRHDHSTRVDGDRTLTVDGTRTTVVKGDDHQTVRGEQIINVMPTSEGSDTRRAIVVQGDIAEFATQHVRIGADTTVEHRCGDCSSEMTRSDITLTASSSITLVCGNSRIEIHGDHISIQSPTIALNGSGAQLTLDANATMQGGAVRMSNSGGATVKLEDAIVKLNC